MTTVVTCTACMTPLQTMSDLLEMYTGPPGHEQTDPMEAMKVFKQTTSTTPMTMAGASMDDNLPTTTILLDADEDVLHDKVGRIETLTTNANTTPNITTTNAVQRTIPTRSAVQTGMAPMPARHVQFHDMDIQ